MNYYHHKILADSRKDENGEIKKGYVHPSKLGACFKVTYVPHYVFEVISWIGVSIVSRTPYGWYVTFGMALFLGIKGYKTRKWYQDATNLKDNQAVHTNENDA